VSLTIEHINPPSMHTNPAFSRAVTVSGDAKTIIIGALDPVDETGALVGRGDLAAQTEQIFKNLEIILNATGARLEDIVIWRIFVAQGQSLHTGAAVFYRWWGTRPNPPANTIVFVPSLGFPDALITLEAVAVVPNV
jgi:enamine deaminase RidA (YjgF/YER057c/UK114 family)